MKGRHREWRREPKGFRLPLEHVPAVFQSLAVFPAESEDAEFYFMSLAEASLEQGRSFHPTGTSLYFFSILLLLFPL